MHKLFYVIGGFAVLVGVYFLASGGNSRDPLAGMVSTQIGLASIFGAVIWLGMGRALELLERIANRIAPPPKPVAETPNDWQFDEAGNVKPQEDNKWAVASEAPKKPEPQSRTEPRF